MTLTLKLSAVSFKCKLHNQIMSTRPLKPSEITDKKVPKHVYDEFAVQGYNWYYDLEIKGYFASNGDDLIGYAPSTRRVWRFMKP